MIDAIATIGNAGDINCWSGTPYHFLQAASSAGWKTEPWRLDMQRFVWPRRRWNLQQFLLGRGMGGFQYSDSFAHRALAAVESRLFAGRVLSFNQHFPPASKITASGGKLCFYLDATFPLLLDRYGIGKHLPKSMQNECLAREREAFQQAEWLVFFQRWSAESAVRDCGADPAKVRVICPGANLHLPADWSFEFKPSQPTAHRPLVLGFIGKDWKRKGLPFLIEVQKKLVSTGVPTVIRCAGGIPENLPKDSGIEPWGFINKHTEPGRFFEFLHGCDLGCLFSEAEASSIAVLEFLHAGIPVSGFTVDGMADLFPPDAGFRFEPKTTAEAVALTLRAAFSDVSTAGKMRTAAQAWSPLVTWERCVDEWRQLLTTGSVKCPVQPWRGLESHAALSSRP
jgi:glycosyltransferase involved in cell wall biosynthesis